MYYELKKKCITEMNVTSNFKRSSTFFLVKMFTTQNEEKEKRKQLLS